MSSVQIWMTPMITLKRKEKVEFDCHFSFLYLTYSETPGVAIETIQEKDVFKLHNNLGYTYYHYSFYSTLVFNILFLLSNPDLKK